MEPPKHYKDQILKKIFDEPELFTQFLKNFVSVPMLKDIKPEQVEDVTERFLPLNQTSRDADVVKKVHLKDSDPPMYVITIIENETNVNHRMPYKMLQYITYAWNDYEKEQQEAHGLGIIERKDFQYPPVLPVVLYDGNGTWTAAHSMVDKVYLSEVFRPYIPDFQYALVDLQAHSLEQLKENRDAMSLVLIMDKLRASKDLEHVKELLPPEYMDELWNKTPNRLIAMINDVVRVLLAHTGMDRDKINEFTDDFTDRRRWNNMFLLLEQGFQEERKQERNKGREEERLEMAKSMLKDGENIRKIAKYTTLPEETLLEMQKEMGIRPKIRHRDAPER